jgi:hypothetical protein
MRARACNLPLATNTFRTYLGGDCHRVLLPSQGALGADGRTRSFGHSALAWFDLFAEFVKLETGIAG